MTKRYPVSPAPGPLEDYATRFDDLFGARAQRHAFRRYLEGLLLPAERNKTLTGLANTEPVVGAQRKQAQSLQWFLSESRWDPKEVNERRLKLLLLEEPSTAANDEGVVVIDEHGDRKWGKRTTHVGRQWLANIGKTENGVVSVSSLWADEGVYYPIAFEPYTPSHHFEGGKNDPLFRTKLKIAEELVEQAVEKSIPFRAVVADSFYGKERAQRAFVVTPDPKELPDLATWYLTTNLPAPGSEQANESDDLAPASVAEVVRLYGLRMWVEQSYKQVKHALGWSDYQVRSDVAIRRHWQLVCLAFSFCWWAYGHLPTEEKAETQKAENDPRAEYSEGRGKKESSSVLAAGFESSEGMAGALCHAQKILEGVLRDAPATSAKTAA